MGVTITGNSGAAATTDVKAGEVIDNAKPLAGEQRVVDPSGDDFEVSNGSQSTQAETRAADETRQNDGRPSTYPAHLAAIFAERPDLETRWGYLHTSAAQSKEQAIDSAQYEVYESINEDHDMPKLQTMLTFLHGQMGADGLKSFVSETVRRLPEVSGKQDARTLLDQWPTQRWGELPDRAELEALAAD